MWSSARRRSIAISPMSDERTSLTPRARRAASIASAASSAAPGPDGPARQGLREAGGELRPLELLLRPVVLEDEQARGLDAFVGREAGLAGAALAAAPHGGRIVQVSRIDDAVVSRAAIRTAHSVPLAPWPSGRTREAYTTLDRPPSAGAGHGVADRRDERVDDALAAQDLGPVREPGAAAQPGHRLVRAGLDDLDLGGDGLADPDRGRVVPLLREEDAARARAAAPRRAR